MQESTVPARTYVPVTDIFETEQALTVVMEMPGVDKQNVEVTVANDLLSVVGRIEFAKYESLQPVYTEYNIGNYARTFQLSGKIDQSKISADIKDGVITLVLSKAEEAKPRKIKVLGEPTPLADSATCRHC